MSKSLTVKPVVLVGAICFGAICGYLYVGQSTQEIAIEQMLESDGASDSFGCLTRQLKENPKPFSAGCPVGSMGSFPTIVSCEQYSGRYTSVDAFGDFRQKLENMIPLELRFVTMRLGIPVEWWPRAIALRFVDPEGDPECPYMWIEWTDVDGKRTPRIAVVTSDAMSGVYDVRKALRHELAHLCHATLATERFDGCPAWFREGMAEWACGTGDGAWRLLMLHEVIDRGFRLGDGEDVREKFIDELVLRDNGHRFDDYALSYAAFAWMEGQIGDQGVRSLIAEVCGGASPEAAIESHVGVGTSVLSREARNWLRARCREEDRLGKQYEASVNALASGAYQCAVDELRKLASDHGESVYGILARRELVTALAMNGQLPAAIEEGERLLSSSPGRRVAEGMRVYLLRLAAAEGRWTEVQRMGGLFMRDNWRASPVLRGTVDALVKAAAR